MKKEKLDAALDAMKHLITDVLEGDETHRFAQAATLSGLAAKVAAQGALGMRDVKKLIRPQFGAPGYDTPEYIGDDGVGYVQGMNQELLPIGGAQIVGNVYQNPDAALPDTVQGLVATLGPVLQAQARTNAAAGRQKLGAELNELLEARERLRESGSEAQADQLTARIDRLIALIAQPEENEDNADVVSTELSRGHSAGATGQGSNQAHDLRADGVGEAGDAGAAPGSGEAAGGGTVLEPTRVPPFRSRLAEGAEPGAAGPDHQDPEGAAEAAETGAGPGERGEVRGREDAGDDREAPADDRKYRCPGYPTCNGCWECASIDRKYG